MDLGWSAITSEQLDHGVLSTPYSYGMAVVILLGH